MIEIASIHTDQSSAMVQRLHQKSQDLSRRGANGLKGENYGSENQEGPQ